MAMQKKDWMIAYFSTSGLLSFTNLYQGESQQNLHLLIMDGHESHVTIEALEQAIEFGIDMVTLPFHTSHTL
jgi:imidazoleglycerol phosphate dehydratase HisB